MAAIEPVADGATTADVTKPKRTVNRKIKLWAYQQEATDAVFEAFEGKGPEDDVRISVCAPTGSGKTVMMLSIIKDLWANSKEAYIDDARAQTAAADEEYDSEEEDAAEGWQREQVLILVPSVQIATQMKTDAKRILRKDFGVKDVDIELEQGDTKSDGTADLTIATWQSLERSPARLMKLNRNKFGLVIVDECHHAASPHFMRVLQYFNECIPLAKGIDPVKGLEHGVRVKMIGFSATPDRNDKYRTTSAFPVRVHTVQAKPLIATKKLSKLAYKMIDGGLNIDELLKSCNEHEQDMSGWTAGDFENKLYEKCNAAIINEHQTHFGEGRRSTLVSVSRLRQLFSLKQAFEAIDVDVQAVTGSTGKEKRDQIINRFREGKFPVLINCGALVEGADMPCIDCLVLARPTTSKILMTQMIGRGMRVSRDTGKQDCLILDFTVSRKSGLKRFPQLYSLVNDLGICKVRATQPRVRGLLMPASTSKKARTDEEQRGVGNGKTSASGGGRKDDVAGQKRTPAEINVINNEKFGLTPGDKAKAQELCQRLLGITGADRQVTGGEIRLGEPLAAKTSKSKGAEARRVVDGGGGEGKRVEKAIDIAAGGGRAAGGGTKDGRAEGELHVENSATSSQTGNHVTTPEGSTQNQKRKRELYDDEVIWLE